MIQPGISRRPQVAALVLALLAAAVPGAAQESAQEREHVVKRGDTLWDLAGHYLANPFLWPMIYEANRSVVEDPHWIYPGERLRIPGVPGEAAQVLGEPVAQAAAAQAVAAEVVVQRADTARAAVAMTLDLRRPLIQEEEYRSAPWLESSLGTRIAGRILRLADEPSAAADKLPPALHPHDRIVVGELQAPAAAVGDSLLIVRLGRELEGYGQVVEPLALVRVDSLGENALIARLIVQYDEARVGDAVLRLDALPDLPLGRPGALANGPEGRLLEFLTEQELYGTGDHGFVAMAGEPLRLGDELAIYVPGERRNPPAGEVLPPTAVARGRVVKLSAHAATIRLIGVFDTGVRGGLPVRLVARMP
jgi:hypothetical protein